MTSWPPPARRGASATLCAFTHEPSHFVQLGFTIVPHIWVPEKIARDCTVCPLFRQCGQYAVTLPLRAGVTSGPSSRRRSSTAAGAVAARRPNVERLQLPPSGALAPLEEDTHAVHA